jgi:cytochrome c551/c552
MSDRQPSRLLYLLTAGVLLLGTLMVVAGTGTKGDSDTNEHRQDSRVGEGRQPATGASGLSARGAVLQQAQCAGCHARERREIGPSYATIVERYHCRPAELSAAIEHPDPGWADYPPGPAGPPLTLADRVALADWILGGGGSGDE